MHDCLSPKGGHVAPPASPHRGHVPAERSRVRVSAVITHEDALHALGGNPGLHRTSIPRPSKSPTSDRLPSHRSRSMTMHVQAGRLRVNLSPSCDPMVFKGRHVGLRMASYSSRATFKWEMASRPTGRNQQKPTMCKPTTP